MTLPRSTLAESVSPSKSVAVIVTFRAPAAIAAESSSYEEPPVGCSMAWYWVIVTAPVVALIDTVKATLVRVAVSTVPCVAAVEP